MKKSLIIQISIISIALGLSSTVIKANKPTDPQSQVNLNKQLLHENKTKEREIRESLGAFYVKERPHNEASTWFNSSKKGRHEHYKNIREDQEKPIPQNPEAP
jgi:hypothetical protein